MTYIETLNIYVILMPYELQFLFANGLPTVTFPLMGRILSIIGVNLRIELWS